VKSEHGPVALSKGEQSSAKSFKLQNRLAVCPSFIFLLTRADNR